MNELFILVFAILNPGSAFEKAVYGEKLYQAFTTTSPVALSQKWDSLSPIARKDSRVFKGVEGKFQNTL